MIPGSRFESCPLQHKEREKMDIEAAKIIANAIDGVGLMILGFCFVYIGMSLFRGK